MYTIMITCCFAALPLSGRELCNKSCQYVRAPSAPMVFRDTKNLYIYALEAYRQYFCTHGPCTIEGLISSILSVSGY